MNNWQDNHFERKIESILSDINYYKPDHHFGRPFITAYQLAIEFAQRFPDDFDHLGYQIGGEGIGERVSLAQYLAGQLSERIKTGKITSIEGCFLSNHHLSDIIFDNNGQQIKSSLTKTQIDLSMFRLHK